MSLDAGVSSLIGAIYSAAHDPSNWRGVLDEIVVRTNSRLVLFSVVDLATGKFTRSDFHGADDARFLDAVHDYKAELHRNDPMLLFAANNPKAGSTSMTQAVAALGSRHDSTDFLQWYKSNFGAGDGVVRYTPAVEGLTLGMSIHTHPDRGVHDQPELALFALLFEHICNAVSLATRHFHASQGPGAWWLVDSHGGVRLSNEAADIILKTDDGVQVIGGKLMCALVQDQRNFLDLLNIVGEKGRAASGAMAIRQPSGIRDWLLSVQHVPGAQSPLNVLGPAALVRIIERDAVPSTDQLHYWRQAFGFTPAEIRLLEPFVACGGGLREAAPRANMQYATARIHLAHIFEKAAVGSQAELLQLLARLR